MGAYENPITAVDDKSAAIIAAGFQSFASSITSAFLERQKKQEELAKQYLVDANNLLVAGAKSAAELESFMQENKEVLGDFGDTLVEQHRDGLSREFYLKNTIDSMAVRNPDDLEKKKQMITEYQTLIQGNQQAITDYTGVDSTIKQISTEASSGFLTRTAGQIDNLDQRNSAAIKVANILGDITTVERPFEKKINSLGENILIFYPKGEPAVEWNITRNGDPRDMKKVSNLTVRIDEALTLGTSPTIVTGKGGFVPSEEYRVYEAGANGGKIAKVNYTVKTLPDGSKRTYATPVYDMERYNTALASAVSTAVNQEQDDYGRLSAFRHYMAGTIVGEKVTYKDPNDLDPITGKPKDKEEIIEKDSFNLDDQGQMSDAQRSLYAAATAAYMQTKYAYVPQAEIDYTRGPSTTTTTTTKLPKATPEEKAKLYYEEFIQDPVTKFEEFTGLAPKWDEKKGTMTISAQDLGEEEGDDIVYNMNTKGGRARFYRKLLDESGYLSGDDEGEKIRRAFSSVVGIASAGEITKRQFITDYIANDPTASKEQAEKAWEFQKRKE
jgi:hypothetical protein